MKLSNKILIGFFGFIFLYLTAAFAELRLTGSPSVIDETNSIEETVDLPAFAVLIVGGFTADVKVIPSDRPRLQIRSFTGDLLKSFNYQLSGDTLTLSGFQPEDVPPAKISLSLFVPETGFRGISVNSSVVIVEGLEQETLLISQNAGRIWMSDTRINNIQIEASNGSYLDIAGTHLDTLSANVEQSQVLINSSVGLVRGSITNGTYLRLNQIREIHLKKDESSKLTLYQ
ncbi:MAG TPA: hypothetical protein VEB86_07875 [Chryseosolibacter sp.]|nr:hypothetical protein [Chryseosolibacter sp.]